MKLEIRSTEYEFSKEVTSSGRHRPRDLSDKVIVKFDLVFEGGRASGEYEMTRSEYVKNCSEIDQYISLRIGL